MFIYKPSLKCLNAPISKLSLRIGFSGSIVTTMARGATMTRLTGRAMTTTRGAMTRTSFTTGRMFNAPRVATLQSSLHSARSAPRSLGLLLGAACTFLLGQTVFNDGLLPANQIHSNTQARYKSSTTYTKERFGLNYEELTIGSVTGLFLGIIVGKLSTIFVFLGLSSYFLIQFLESRNIINISWNSIVTVGKNKINVKELVLENTSFKLAFVLTFLVAAYNI